MGLRSKRNPRQAIHPKDQVDFAAVLQIVFQHVLDIVNLTIIFIREGLGALDWRPALQAAALNASMSPRPRTSSAAARSDEY